MDSPASERRAGSIFISYRRADSSGYGGRLCEALQRWFGEDRVFRDIDSIRPGTDFVEVLSAAVARSGAVLALIGREWLTVADGGGHPRLEDPADFVRIELESAIEQQKVIIPVLVQGARVPPPSALPPPLAKLARFQGIELSEERWNYDLGRLIAALEGIVGSPHAEAPEVPVVAAPTTAPPEPSPVVPDLSGLETTVVDAPPRPRPAVAAEKAPRVPRGLRRTLIAVVASIVVASGVLVAIALTRAPAARVVPSVVSEDVAIATATLRKAGFAVNQREQPDDTNPPGRVTAQLPPARAKAAKGAVVTVVVSTGRVLVPVPSVVNLATAQAIEALHAAGLVENTAFQASDAVPDDSVISQDPAPGTPVPKASPVTITVSTGQTPVPTNSRTVPTVSPGNPPTTSTSTPTTSTSVRTTATSTATSRPAPSVTRLPVTTVP